MGYFETENNEYAGKVQAESEVVQRWNKFMANVIESVILEDGRVSGVVDLMGCMFYHK